LTNCRDSTTGEYRKEVLLYHPHPESQDRFTSFTAYLDTHEGFKLHDKVVVLDKEARMIKWKVGNIKYSRKDFEKIMT